MPLLQVIEGQNRGSLYFLEPTTNVLGRDSKCHVVLYDTFASRQHTKILFQNGRYLLEDLGSKNGTKLNGLPVVETKSELEEGDRISIGDTELIFLIKELKSDSLTETQFSPEDTTDSLHWFVDSSQKINVLGESSKMKEIASQVFRVAPQDIPVLITGESGTGKELIARSIHRNSKRRKAPFHAINCATIESLAESELFGHEKGAFTGAVARRQGIFELANGGTLFLDEIGDATSGIQAKLLRVLETGSFYRVGGSSLIHTDIRLIAATNQNLKEKMKANEFREDLYYRLQGLEIPLPSLRERGEDIKLLAEHFLKIFSPSKLQVPKLSPDAITLLKKYSFPGNIRELKNLIERVLILKNKKENGQIESKDLKPYLVTDADSSTSTQSFLKMGTLEEAEKTFIDYIYQQTGKNKSETARILDINRVTLYAKLKKYGLG